MTVSNRHPGPQAQALDFTRKIPAGAVIGPPHARGDPKLSRNVPDSILPQVFFCRFRATGGKLPARIFVDKGCLPF